MFVLNGISQPISTKRSYLLRSIFPAVYLRPPLATIRRSSLMSSSCTIVTFFESPFDQAGRVLSQPARGESNRKRAEAFPKGDGLFRFHLRQTLPRPVVAGALWSPGRGPAFPSCSRSMTANDVNRGARELEAPRLVAGVCRRSRKTHAGAKLLLFVFQSWTWSCQIPSMKNV